MQREKGLVNDHVADNNYHQAHHTRNSWNQSALLYICGCNDLKKIDEQRPGVTRMRDGRIREGGSPRLQLPGGVECDTRERVFSSARRTI